MMHRCFWAVVFLCCSTSISRAERLEQARSYLGTSVSATVCHSSWEQGKAREAMSAVWKRFADIHAHMNAFDPASDVSAINAADGKEVMVHADVYELLKRSKEYAHLTGGVFDITVRPLTALWEQAGKNDVLPTADEVSQAKKLVGAQHIELLDGLRVKIPSGMKVDLGGDASGFAADEAAKIFRASGFRDFLVDAGGEIYAAGQACEGRPWRVGVNDPEHKGRWTDIVELKDQALSTSGSYIKYIEINGERWPHIINPVTGYPERGVVSATVLAPNATDADVLSTALCVLGSVPGFRLIDSLGQGYAAMLMIDNGNALEERSSSGYADLKVGQ